MGITILSPFFPLYPISVNTLRLLTPLLALVFFSCSNTTRSDSSEIAEVQLPDLLDSEELRFTQDDQENIQHLIKITLKDLFKEDIEKGYLDTLSRQFKYSQFDLNQDGNKEIFVGLTGPFFCGSGGCTMLLLSDHGEVITRFTVVDYPVYVITDKSKGWNNLVIFSGGENRLLQFDGQGYPSNPSTLEVYSRDLDNMNKILDWESQESYSFY